MASSDPDAKDTVYVVRAIERVEERIAALAERVEQHLTHRRKTPSKAVREAHIRAIAAMGGCCPFCDAALFTPEGEFVGVIHHHDKASDATAGAVMPACADCNNRFNGEPTPRAVVDAYHLRRARHEEPLVQRMRHRVSLAQPIAMTARGTKR